MSEHFIVFNAGSSSLKFSLFDASNLRLSFHGIVDDVPGNANLTINDADKNIVYKKDGFSPGYDNALSELLNWTQSNVSSIAAAGHRVVHGGMEFSKPVTITPEILSKLKDLIMLAPLHQPHNIAVIEAFLKAHPGIIQIACFDTAFHRTQSNIAQSFALPYKLTQEGIIRYGFHGLSYEYIASVLSEYVGPKAGGRTIAAHLGNGASMCAIKDFKSVATTMGFTALDGLMMGTRCGDIDPGVLLYLLEEKDMSATQLSNLLYNDSGLKGVSGINHDIRILLESNEPKANDAIDLFCYQAAKQLSGLIPAIGGLETIVFTAGIGEGAPFIRKNICKHLSWLGVEIFDDANDTNQSKISTDNSKIEVYVIPTNEELVIAKSISTK